MNKEELEIKTISEIYEESSMEKVVENERWVSVKSLEDYINYGAEPTMKKLWDKLQVK